MIKAHYLFIIILFASCNHESPFTQKNKLLGNWEMTEYKIDGAYINDFKTFSSTKLNIEYFQYIAPSLFAKRNAILCSFQFPMTMSFDENNISFSLKVCDTLNKIDPYFYKTLDTTNNGISGSWDLEYFNKRIFIINNLTKSRKRDIRIIFEKVE